MFDHQELKAQAAMGQFMNLIFDVVKKTEEKKAKIISLRTKIDGLEKAKILDEDPEENNAA